MNLVALGASLLYLEKKIEKEKILHNYNGYFLKQKTVGKYMTKKRERKREREIQRKIYNCYYL